MAVKSPTKEDRYLARYAARNATPHGSEGDKQSRFTNDDELNQWLEEEKRKAADRSATYQKDDKEEREQHEQDKSTEAKLERVDAQSKKTHNKAERDDEVKAQEKKQQEEADKAEKERQEAQDTFTGLIKYKVKKKVDDTTKKVGKAAYSIGNWKTPGGIGLLIVILLLLAATVVAVNANGDTRLKQWWYMLSGRAILNGSTPPVAGGIPYTTIPSVISAIGTVTPQVVTPLLTGLPAIGPVAQAVQAVGTIEQFANGIGSLLGGSQFRNQFGGLP